MSLHSRVRRATECRVGWAREDKCGMRGVCVGIILAASLSLVSVPTAAASSGPCTLLGYESRSGGTPREIEQRAHQGRGDVGVTDLSSSHWRVDPRSKLIVQQVGLGP